MATHVEHLKTRSRAGHRRPSELVKASVDVLKVHAAPLILTTLTATSTDASKLNARGYFIVFDCNTSGLRSPLTYVDVRWWGSVPLTQQARGKWTLMLTCGL